MQKVTKWSFNYLYIKIYILNELGLHQILIECNGHPLS